MFVIVTKGSLASLFLDTQPIPWGIANLTFFQILADTQCLTYKVQYEGALQIGICIYVFDILHFNIFDSSQTGRLYCKLNLCESTLWKGRAMEVASQGESAHRNRSLRASAGRTRTQKQLFYIFALEEIISLRISGGASCSSFAMLWLRAASLNFLMGLWTRLLGIPTSPHTLLP